MWVTLPLFTEILIFVKHYKVCSDIRYTTEYSELCRHRHAPRKSSIFLHVYSQYSLYLYLQQFSERLLHN